MFVLSYYDYFVSLFIFNSFVSYNTSWFSYYSCTLYANTVWDYLPFGVRYPFAFGCILYTYDIIVRKTSNLKLF